MINLSELSDVNRLANSMGNLILAIPNQNEGIRPQDNYEDSYKLSKKIFVFDYEDEQTLDLESEITEHYTESSEMLTDNISIKPEIITTSGFIGELNNKPDSEFLTQAQNVIEDRLVSISQFLPEISSAAQSALNRAEAYNRNLKKIQQIETDKWQSVNTTPAIFTGIENPEEISEQNKNAKNQSRQAQAFQLFYGYYKKRNLFTVHTPWGVFKNCAIQSLRASQDGTTRYVTNFNVTFKVVRIASTIYEIRPEEVPFNPKDSTTTTRQQADFEMDKGAISLSRNELQSF